jgi:glycogenin glucosyltransferase
MLYTALMAMLVHVAAEASSASPSQLLVLGMHHSGTSVVANLTMMMGLYGGTHDEMLLHPTNPLKFWERHDVVDIDERRLAAGASTTSERYEIPDWVAYGFDKTKAVQKIDESTEARNVVKQLNAHRPWVTKDPRMCLVADEWMKLLDAPLCVIAHRQPLSIANSMMIYSHNVSFAEWASVYEAYYTNALRACKGVPTIIVEHDDIKKSPYTAAKKLFDDLVAVGVQGLTMPSEERISALLRASQQPEATYLASERKVLGAMAHRVSEAIVKASVEPVELEPHQWLHAPRKANEAFATLLTTANVEYFRGALVLGSSIRSFDSSRDLIALVTSSVPSEWHSALGVAGWTVVPVEEVEEFWWAKSPDCSKFEGDQSERWGHMATKLRLWQMKQYQRILYLDADTVLTGDATEIFNTVGFAAEKPRYHTNFNAGVMLISPSQTTFDELMALGAADHKSLFGNVIDCTEQGLLNSYYDGTPGREVTKLSVGRADVVADWNTESTPFAVHWITHVCPKPWLVVEGKEELLSHCDPVVYAYWERLWNRLTSSATDESSSNSVGSREIARRKLRRLAGVSAGPSMVARGHQMKFDSVSSVIEGVQHSIGRQLRQLTTSRRELRRRRGEYDSGVWSETTWAWIAIIGTLVLGLGAGALLHKLFIKAPTNVTKGMTVVQAKRMGFEVLGEGKGPTGVVSAVDDDDDDEDEDDEEAPPPPKK